MKKTLRIFAFLTVAVLGFTFMSCDDKEEITSKESLPTEAQTFLSTYYPEATVAFVTKEGSDYNVTLSTYDKIEFNKKGEWQDVEAPVGQTIPAGIAPVPIEVYVAATFPQDGINEISRESYGYKVELVTGLDIQFDKDGNLKKIEKYDYK